jgi:RNA polymerase sigma factor (TIGR02999 family)
VAAAEELFASLYSELHRLAESQLRRNGGALVIGTTSLLHEAFLNMVGREDVVFTERARFFAYAARVMRGLTIDYLRRRQAQKRGAQLELTLEENGELSSGVLEAQRELTSLTQSLADLAQLDPSLSELIDLHFFGGLSFIEIANLRQVSERTVHRDWQKAKLLLRRSMRADA